MLWVILWCPEEDFCCVMLSCNHSGLEFDVLSEVVLKAVLVLWSLSSLFTYPFQARPCRCYR